MILPQTTDAAEAADRSDWIPVEVARHILVLAAAIILWVWSMGQVDESALGDYGLIAILPVSAFAALVVAVVGYVVAIRFHRPGPLLATYTLSLTVMLHGLPTFAYDHLRYAWAWKHVGMVDYIQRFGDVDVAEGAMSVYHNWPGFFGVNAWITESSGLDSALSYAAWAPILFSLLFVGALYVMFRAFTADQRMIWTALLIFVLGSWVGQNYFAPQSLGFFMYLMIMAVLLRWFSTAPSTEAGLEGIEEPHGVVALTLTGLLVIAMLTIASSHQLTPVLTIAAIGGLVAFRQIKISWPLWTMIGVTLVWFLGPARDFVLDNVQNILREFGGVQSNLDNTIVNYETVSNAQRNISMAGRLLSASIFSLAAFGWVRRRRSSQTSGWVLLLGVVPAVMIFASSYGGEIIFRAYLFALPFAAFLAASLWFPTHSTGQRLRSHVALGGVLLLMMAGLLVADFGADRRQVFNDDEVAAADHLMANAGPGSLIIEGTRDYPRLYLNNEQHTYLTLDRLPTETLDRVLAEPAELISTWLDNDDEYPDGYIILTESQHASVSTLGDKLEPTLTTIEESLRNSRLFEISFESGSAVVFHRTGQT